MTTTRAGWFVSVPAMLNRIRVEGHGFLTDHDVKALAGHEDGRLVQLLVRAGGCRFVCASQDVLHLTRALEAVGDYVRDVSLPAGDVR